MARKRAETRVGLHHAKTHFSELLRRVEAGDEITLLRRGKPIARLVPIKESPVRRPLGVMRGQWHLPDSETLLAHDEEVEVMFYGDDE